MPLPTHPVTSIAPEAQSEEDFVALGKLGGDAFMVDQQGINSPSSALLSRFR